MVPGDLAVPAGAKACLEQDLIPVKEPFPIGLCHLCS